MRTLPPYAISLITARPEIGRPLWCETRPIPARFTILLGERLERQADDSDDGGRGQGFLRLQMYSNFPFRERPGSPYTPASTRSSHPPSVILFTKAYADVWLIFGLTRRKAV